MELVFLTPVAALAGFAALLPFALALIRERRDGRLRRAIGVQPPRASARFASALAAAALVACLAAAAAQPGLRTKGGRRARADAQLVFVLDVSRSMLARARPGAPTRFDRASALAARLRAAFPEVPAGLASLSDWLLPHAFPTLDQRVFAQTLTRAVGIEYPRPLTLARNATDFGGLFALGAGRYFAPTAKHRVAIVLSDGESRRFALAPVLGPLRDAHVRLLLVRVWGPREAIYNGRRRDRRYVPDLLAAVPLGRLAARTGGGRVFSEHERGAIEARARVLLGRGPLVTTSRRPHTTPLAPYVVLAGVLPLGFLLRRR
jgi:hypothetical protein